MMLAVGSECIFCQDLEAAYLIHPICRQYPPHTLANPVPTGKPIFPVIVLTSLFNPNKHLNAHSYDNHLNFEF